MPSVALIVHACDRYEFLYKGFGIFFHKHWDKNIACNYYFATEEKQVEIPGFTNIRSGKGEWADRLRVLLEKRVKEDYVLYMQEDMWLTRDVDARFMNPLFDLVVANKWNLVKLHSSEVYKTNATGKRIEGFEIAKVDNEQSGFLMSHQVSIWNRKFLIKQLHPKEHPWRNERKGTKRLKQLNPEIYHVDYFAENGKPAINSNDAGAKRSEYYTVSVNAGLNERIERYLPVLEAGTPGEQEYAKKLRYNYEHQLTHDGKEKPRKQDVFNKIKHWFKGKK